MAIVDRTWSCPLRTQDGFRLLEVGGSPGFVGIDDGAQMTVSDALGSGDLESGLTSVYAGGISVNRRCVAAMNRIALTRTGLPGPPARFQTQYDCELTPRKILVRVRATVRSPGNWVKSGPVVRLRKAVSNAEMAVQTPKRRPLAFMTIGGDQVRIWVSPGCVRD